MHGFTDCFDDAPLAKRTTLGRHGEVERAVTDVEGVIGIDHGALRIKPMIDQRWGRAGVVYGPIERRSGLLFAVLILNGHNTSQSEPLSDSFVRRLIRWLQGHTTSRAAIARRLEGWLRYPRKRVLMRQLRSWWHMARAEFDPLDENLAVGWFAAAELATPAPAGSLFVMHAARGDNGELWVRIGPSFATVASGVQNVPMCYAIVLRDVGAAYYIASLPRAHATAPLPRFRPLAIDATDTTPILHAGIHQAVLGQVGFRVDSRVYGVQVEPVEALAAWYGTAHAADRLWGSGRLDGRTAEIGGGWDDSAGSFELEPSGVRATGKAGVAILRPPSATGLVHVRITGIDDDSEGGPMLRFGDGGSHIRLAISTSRVRLVAVSEGSEVVLADDTSEPIVDSEHQVQVLDDGCHIRATLDGRSLFGGRPILVRGGGGQAVGLHASAGCTMTFDSFEAHPTEVDLSDALRLEPPWFAQGDDLVARDDFSGEGEHHLAGRSTPVGGRTWRRDIGAGRIVTIGGRAVVDASVDRPNPGETIYTIPCLPDHEVIDVAVDVTPPGTGPGSGERGRGGLVLWQDRSNYLVISMYVDDSYDGASIAIFSHLDGFEDIYDAVWSMVGTKIYWGRTHRLRVASDGEHVLVWIDDEPVLYRRVSDLYPQRSPMLISRVGIAANWEWGDDTGTAFGDFVVLATHRGTS